MNSSSLIIKGSVLSTAKWKNTVWLWLNWPTFKPTKWMSWLATLFAFAVRPINWKSFFCWRGREKPEGYMDVAYILPTSYGTFHLKRHNKHWKPKAMSAILLALINNHKALIQLSEKKSWKKKSCTQSLLLPNTEIIFLTDLQHCSHHFWDHLPESCKWASLWKKTESKTSSRLKMTMLVLRLKNICNLLRASAILSIKGMDFQKLKACLFFSPATIQAPNQRLWYWRTFSQPPVALSPAPSVL